MKKPSSYIILFLSLIFFFSCSLVSFAYTNEDFLKCLTVKSYQNQSLVPNNDIYTQNNPSFLKVLQLPTQNFRFNTNNTLRPQIIVTPTQEFEAQSIISCARKHQIHVRVRSGGHDYEGLSYTTHYRDGDQFVTLDLINMRNITVNAREKTAWVGAGSTLGELYYEVSKSSQELGFPAGVCPTIGVGGHFSGGGYGTLMRKHGLSADHVVDARLVDPNGRILDRRLMGEDLFWAIRGGGGNSFGVVLAWKVQLVDVPKIVTVFTINKSLAQNATWLVHKWQSIAPKLPKELFIRIVNMKANGNVVAAFNSLYLGRANDLVPIMQLNFPELGLTIKDCTEMSWAESILYFAGFTNVSRTEELLSRVPLNKIRHFKAKSDYVVTPIPEEGIEAIWGFLNEIEDASGFAIFSPYGGRMDEILSSSIPFPHRRGVLYKIQYLVYWDEDGYEASIKYINRIRRLYDDMGKFVSKNPRQAYINYRDLDIGMNKEGNTSYSQASIWGKKYFNNNFDRLVHVKTKFDPTNFFRNEQSIPPVLYAY